MATTRRSIRTTLSNFLFRITGGRLGGGGGGGGGGDDGMRNRRTGRLVGPGPAQRRSRDVSRPNPSIVRGGGND